MDTAITKDPDDPDVRFAAARAVAAACKPMAARDPEKGRQLAVRALELLEGRVQKHEADFGRIDDDQSFDPIRDDQPFLKFMSDGHPGRRYAAVWSIEKRVEQTAIEGCDPAEHLDRCRKLVQDGYRPVAWSAVPTTEGPLVTASVWHRPVVSEQERDRLAERQARAAVALIRLRKGAEVWEYLQHSRDPRLRSFIINWLKPLHGDPGRRRRIPPH